MNEIFMQRCIELAKTGLGNVAPNPMVGSVIVYESKIIGEGYHQKFGEAHAEVNAINSVKDKSLLKRSTLFVSLEPCSHYGKTPPCSDLIIKHKIPKVVIGCMDTFSEVSGKGIKKLTEAGLDVTIGILEKECRKLNERFFTYHEKKRPYIILKWAQSLDGFIGDELKHGFSQLKISSELSHTLVHKWRTEEQAILIGTNTALRDNPQLNVRYWKGKNPLRAVIDKELKLPENLNLFDKSISTIIFNNVKNEITENIEYCKIDFSRNIISQILQELFDKEILSVIVEGGMHLLNSFIHENLWDEARVFFAPMVLSKGIKAPILKGDLKYQSEVAGDKLFIFKNSEL
jgi:diaminohydroxyphosphoribosylaminopyrimidine deaminase / 5-amino-6-(5-phosphoribosylamino)uracil reductase